MTLASEASEASTNGERVLVLQDPDIDSSRFLLADVDPDAGPKYLISETAKFFFGRKHSWLRWREREGDFDLDGEPFEVRRTEGGVRYFLLGDIERMAHALAQGRHIDGARLLIILGLIKGQAQLHRLLPTPRLAVPESDDDG